MIVIAITFAVFISSLYAAPRVQSLAIESADAPTRPANHVDWDVERTTIDTIVIHHTGTTNELSVGELDAAGLERAYAPVFQNGNSDPVVPAGTPPYSGHYLNLDGKVQETFILYHVFIQQDGTVVKCLPDSVIGWQAGNWGVNCRSLSICLSGDFTSGKPRAVQMSAAAWQIAEWCQCYPTIHYIVGHRNVRKASSTICPGNWWYTGGRQELIALASQEAGKRLKFWSYYPATVRWE